MRKRTTFLVFLSGLALASCAAPGLSSSGDLPTSSLPSSSGTSSGSTVIDLPSSTTPDTSSTPGDGEKTTVSFSDALSLLANVQGAEKTVSAETMTVTNASDYGRIVTKDERLQFYEDGSTYGEGTIVETTDGAETLKDTFQRRSQARVDKFQTDEGGVADVAMLYQIVDYKEEAFPQDDYKDSVDRIFVFPTAEDATKAGLTADEYILQDDVPLAVGFQHVGTLYNFILAQLSGNVYVQQTGIDSMSCALGEEGYTYTTVAKYQVDGDLNDVLDYSIEVSFTLDEERERLLEYKTTYTVTDTSKSDLTDVSVDTVTTSGTLSYGTREAAPATDPLPVLDYYLQDIEDITLLDASREAIDPQNVSNGASFLFAIPKTYTPSKAIINGEWELTPYESSNEAAVLEEGGYFEVVGGGDATLTFVYLGMEDGVWENKFVSIDVHVLYNDPVQDIAFSSGYLPEDNQLAIGKTYDIPVYVTPTTADPTFTATSSDPAVLDATVSEDGDVVLTPLAEGEATVTITSTADPTKTASETFRCFASLTSEETISYLTGKTFRYESIWGYSEDISFENEKRGKVVLVTDTGSSTYAFSYEADGMNIHLLWDDDFAYDEVGGFEDGYLGLDRTYLVFDRPEGYTENRFDLVEE